MRNHLGSLLLRQPVIHRTVQVEGYLAYLVVGDQGGDSDQAAITGARSGEATNP